MAVSLVRTRAMKARMTPARTGEARAHHGRLIASLHGYGNPARADGAGLATLMRIGSNLRPEPVWDLKIVAARILARKSVPPG